MFTSKSLVVQSAKKAARCGHIGNDASIIAAVVARNVGTVKRFKLHEQRRTKKEANDGLPLGEFLRRYKIEKERERVMNESVENVSNQQQQQQTKVHLPSYANKPNPGHDRPEGTE
eukprot:GEZU01009855.1.p1 GENE.GEZU01009855.1~~GEZU01009855.1.p1  ORF type:complete len:116 (+),score=18.76 GEZU01009855.1:174-521(+)